MRIQNHAPEGFIALDNSALIYPPTEAVFNANTFRVSMDLRQPIKKEILEQALADLLDRCNYAKVSLHSGFFWYYLSPNPKSPLVHEEGSYPTGRISFKENNGYLFKVIYGEHRIALEFFHALTDGSGAMAYLKLLVERYLYHSKAISEHFPDGLSYDQRSDVKEFSDPFQHLYNKQLPSYPQISKAYHRNGTGTYDDRVKVIRAKVKADVLKKRSKERGLTITEYLCTILLYCFQELQQREVGQQNKRKPIRLSVPMNLRTLFGYETQRNFTLFAVIGIETVLGTYTFDEISKEVHLQLALAQSRKRLLSQIRRNVGGERNLLIRFAPNALKNPLFKLLSDTLGDDQYTAVLSNLGYVQLPPVLAQEIGTMDFHLSAGLLNKVALAVIGCLDSVVMNFTSFYNTDTELERLFCNFLVEDGVGVEISTNR